MNAEVLLRLRIKVPSLKLVAVTEGQLSFGHPVKGKTTTALALIAHGADSKTISKDESYYGFTPLQACAAGGMISRLKLLLDEPSVMLK